MILCSLTPAVRRALRVPETRHEIMGVFQRAWTIAMRRGEPGRWRCYLGRLPTVGTSAGLEIPSKFWASPGPFIAAIGCAFCREPFEKCRGYALNAALRRRRGSPTRRQTTMLRTARLTNRCRLRMANSTTACYFISPSIDILAHPIRAA